MKTLKQLEKQKLEIEKQIKELKSVQEVYYEDKNIKIIKWEKKKFGDFPMPKGYDFANFQDFCNLINNKKIKTVDYEYFITKNPLTNKSYPLFGTCSSGGGGWNAGYDVLSSSGRYGRVVIKKIEENNK